MATAAVLAALSGCATAPVTSPVPAQRPPAPDLSPAAYEPSRDSAALTARFARIERRLRSQGLLRTETAPADARFDADTLATNFVRIALFDEFVPVSEQIVARETASRLRRWDDPVRIEMVFGDSVADEQIQKDMAEVRALSARLSRASGHPVSVVPRSGNFTVFVVDEDERRALGPALQAHVPGITEPVLQTVTDLSPTTFCLVIAFSNDTSPDVYRKAIAIIRGEHPPLLRQSCFHEEITQGLGLANDSPEARPSIFNDDEEFALLTAQDELMLRMLYDPRLSPGMRSAAAMPLVKQIANEYLSEPEPPAGAPAPTPVSQPPTES